MKKITADKYAPYVAVGFGIGFAYLLGYSKGGAHGIDMGTDVMLAVFDRAHEKGALEYCLPGGRRTSAFREACFDEDFKQQLSNKLAATHPIRTILFASSLKNM